MTLSIIGSGFGRTGTRSLKEALETLGFAPCHHMEEVFEHPEQVAYWQAIAAGETVDMSQVFAGYRAQVDWPGAHVWRELVETFPEAKVVHSVRPAESWWKSFSTTIGKLLPIYADMPLPPHMLAMLDAAKRMVADQTFGGLYQDKDAALTAYRERNEEVLSAVPPERLLVFDVAEGWEPLCRFLDVPVPDVPFPHRNMKSEFWDVLGGEPA